MNFLPLIDLLRFLFAKNHVKTDANNYSQQKRISHSVYPDRNYSYNEIFQSIKNTKDGRL